MKTSVLVRIKEIYLPEANDDPNNVVGSEPDFTGKEPGESDSNMAGSSQPAESDPYDFR
jgi:hypothetical protein